MQVQLAIAIHSHHTDVVVDCSDGASDMRAVAATVLVPLARAGVVHAGDVTVAGKVFVDLLVARVDDADHDIGRGLRGGSGQQERVVCLDHGDAVRLRLQLWVTAIVGLHRLDLRVVFQALAPSIRQQGHHGLLVFHLAHHQAASRTGCPATALGIVALRGLHPAGAGRAHLDDVAPVVHGCIRTGGSLGQGANTGGSGREQHGQYGETNGHFH